MAQNDGLVVVHDAEQDRWLQFKRPVRVVVATTVAQVVEKLRQVEMAVNNDGFYAAGYVGYEAASAFDSRLTTCLDGELPLLWFGLYDRVAVVELPLPEADFKPLSWWPSVAKENYLKSIETIKGYIAQGETYQVNYTYPLECKFSNDVDAWTFFKTLQSAQQGNYGAFVDMGRFAICSASPELFFTRNGDLIRTKPMKGTAPRGENYAQDLRLRDELVSSEKNRAENLMIVDMLRNDLGRIADVGSIEVDQLFQVEGYPTLWQMTTQVQARSRCSIVDIFTALFPCSSITGAPKVRTMEIIAQLEKAPRQVYTGSIGFILPDGRSQFNVAIRTALIDRQQQHAEYSVGGGIVWDSVAEQEYSETQTKAKVLTVDHEPPRLLETLLWEPETGYRLLEQHLQRLAMSAQQCGCCVDINTLRQQLICEAAAHSIQRWRVRCLVQRCGQATLEFSPQPYQSQRHAVQLVLAHGPSQSGNPFFKHKTENRDYFAQLLNTARKQYGAQVDDVVMWNERGEITETTIANIVIYCDGEWVTPALECGLLAGTLRQVLLNQGIIVEKVITVDQLRSATDIYLINSVRGWRWAQLSRK